MPLKKNDCNWAFDFRTNFNGYHSSDSESDSADTHLLPETADNRLLKDIDLSSREERVSYKPNPFSIAKINAAYRSTGQGGVRHNVASVEASKAGKNSGQRTIMEGFKAQASRPTPTSVDPIAKRSLKPQSSTKAKGTVGRPHSDCQAVDECFIEPIYQHASSTSSTATLAAAEPRPIAFVTPNRAHIPTSSALLASSDTQAREDVTIQKSVIHNIAPSRELSALAPDTQRRDQLSFSSPLRPRASNSCNHQTHRSSPVQPASDVFRNQKFQPFNRFPQDRRALEKLGTFTRRKGPSL